MTMDNQDTTKQADIEEPRDDLPLPVGTTAAGPTPSEMIKPREPQPLYNSFMRVIRR